MSPPQTLAADVAGMPKVELHLHLEGCISPSRIDAWRQAAGVVAPRPLDKLFEVSSLAEFLETLDWVCGLVQTPQQVCELADDFSVYASTQNLIYAELIINPAHWQLSFDDLLTPLLERFRQIAAQGGVEVGLLPSIGRHQSAGEAMALAQWCCDHPHPHLRGLSIDGDERGGSHNERFAPAFALIKQAGLAATVHAGESSGAQGVAEALDLLQADRIDHGVRAIEDPLVVARLAKQEIPLNVCVSSNCHHLYRSYEEHPLRQLLEAGVRCTLNTDDPSALGIDLNHELATLAKAYGWSLKTLAAFQLSALDAAFCNADRKAELRLALQASPNPR